MYSGFFLGHEKLTGVGKTLSFYFLIAFDKLFFNNRMVGVALAPETFKVGSKGWDWSMGSIEDP